MILSTRRDNIMKSKYQYIDASNLLWFEGEDQNIRYDAILIDIKKILPFVKSGIAEPTENDLKEAALRFIEAHEPCLYITDETVFELFE